VSLRGTLLLLARTHGGLIRRCLVRFDVLARRFSLLSTGVSLGNAWRGSLRRPRWRQGSTFRGTRRRPRPRSTSAHYGGPTRQHDAHARARCQGGVLGYEPKLVPTSALGSLRHCTPNGRRDRRSPRDVPLSPLPLSPRRRPTTPLGCPPRPDRSSRPCRSEDTILRWIVRDLTGILLICDERMRGVSVGSRGSEGCAAFSLLPPPFPFLLFRSDGGRYDDA